MGVVAKSLKPVRHAIVFRCPAKRWLGKASYAEAMLSKEIQHSEPEKKNTANVGGV